MLYGHDCLPVSFDGADRASQSSDVTSRNFISSWPTAVTPAVTYMRRRGTGEPDIVSFAHSNARATFHRTEIDKGARDASVRRTPACAIDRGRQLVGGPTEINTPFEPSALSRSTSTEPVMVSRSKKSGSCLASLDRLFTVSQSQGRPLLSSSW